MKYAFLFSILLISMAAACQPKELHVSSLQTPKKLSQKLIGCWNLVKSDVGFIWEKKDAIDENTSGFWFKPNGQLTKRVASTWGDEVTHVNDYSGAWKITEDGVLTMTYYFDIDQTVQEQVQITHFDAERIEWKRQNWIEIRK